MKRRFAPCSGLTAMPVGVPLAHCAPSIGAHVNVPAAASIGEPWGDGGTHSAPALPAEPEEPPGPEPAAPEPPVPAAPVPALPEVVSVEGSEGPQPGASARRRKSGRARSNEDRML